MRVIECNECGETVQAATDAELVERLGEHLQEEHEIEGEDLEELVEAEAYDATDS